MKTQEEINFERIADAIAYLKANFYEQPSLERVAEQVHLSPYHFQKLFTDWAGVSPKKFLQYLTIGHAKKMLQQDVSLFSAALESGLSGTGRLHDLFVSIEGMTPGEYKNGGENLTISYHFTDTPFGRALTAATPKGICFLAFVETDEAALNDLRQQFPNARYEQALGTIQQNAIQLLLNNWQEPALVKLHLKATPFQLKVWESLLKIPMGRLGTYGDIARSIALPGASRAVGSAVGDNPVAFLIPCHRVIRATGVLGNYRWGQARKEAMIGWEAAQTENAFAS
ncbi:cysteine methyltransferase [Pedobacter yulinensis]|uniref:methylated-DNA--[protein]-cysteine S-methyltransferase n=1 Tax=Pedobacter yulinensis TaxID=2126353 RepID=A0A2T3HQU3_9SPHI|nr:methylated-DNA--[protein]-cysteine S-methyltransferase [Pedobacter yulinensis]PST84786.1 cysteine methyltransferase [Pedobacter yulinensis]